MKKTLALALVGILLVLSLASCGGVKDYVNYAKTDLSTYVTPGEYKNLTVELPHVDPVTDEAVEEEIQRTLNSHAELAVVERAAEEGDTVNIDYVGTMDGVEFEGGSDTGSELVLGEGGMIDGFEDGIVGMTAGETKTVDVTFPDPYDNNPDLAGKPAQFKITLNSVSEEVVPEFTDEFVAELGSDDHSHIDDDHKDSVKTVEDYRAYVREQLEETYNEDVRSNQYLYTWTAIVNGCEVKSYPESAVKKYANDLYNYNYTWFASSGYSQYGLTAENFGITKEAMTEEARENLKEELCLWAIAKANNITVSDEEYTAKVNALVESTNKTLAAQYEAGEYTPYTAETYLKTTTRQSVETKVLYDKIVGEAIATATFTEAE